MELVRQQAMSLLYPVFLFKQSFDNYMFQFADGEYPNYDIPLVTNRSLLNTLFYLLCLGFLNSITPFVTQYRFLAGLCKVILQTVPTFLYLLNLNPNALHALVYNLAPIWARPYSGTQANPS